MILGLTRGAKVSKISNKSFKESNFRILADIKIFLGDDEEIDNEVIDEEVDDYNDDQAALLNSAAADNPLVAVGSQIVVPGNSNHHNSRDAIAAGARSSSVTGKLTRDSDGL